MAYVITRLCRDCVDGACVEVCPKDCIVAFQGPELPNQLFIDPEECIDCRQCEPVCPWEAIYADDEVPAAFSDDVALNAQSVQREKGFVVLRTSKNGAPTRQEVEANRERWGLSPR